MTHEVFSSQHPPLAELAEQLAYDDLMNCMRCGFCLPACPTYAVTGDDFDSPRGRISLAKAVADGQLSPDDPGFAQAFDRCIGCLACQEVCPSGVQYNRIFEQARAFIEARRTHGPVRRLAFSGLFLHQGLMRTAAALMRFYQKSGLQALVRKSGVLHVMGRLGALEPLLPKLAAPQRMASGQWLLPSSDRAAHAVAQVQRIDLRNRRAIALSAPARKNRVSSTATAVEAAQDSERANACLRVGLFGGCIMDAALSVTNVNTARLLQYAGVAVINVRGQACCGALHAHNGDLQHARELAKRNIAAFEQAEVDLIVSNAGGCGAQFFEYPELLQDEPLWHARACRFLEKVVDVTELLDRLDNLEGLRPIEAVVTYQDSCHLRNVMGVTEAPRKLIQSVPGVRFVELPEAEKCCGSGGIYNVTQYDFSMQVLDRKLAFLKQTQADYLLTTNPGCQLQLAYVAKRSGLPLKVMHIVDFLAQALPEER
ncbi:MAG: (Fe-S)-binding protein [Firmicutes bacterium]|nr:(Fe-S)-binding protein [Bacillota bacterium]